MKMEQYPNEVLVIDYRPEYKGDAWRPVHPKVGVYSKQTSKSDPNWEGQSGISTNLYLNDMPGAFLWWFIQDNKSYFKNVNDIVIFE